MTERTAMGAVRASGAGVEIARMLVTLAYVLAGTAAAIVGLGALPRLLAGDTGPHRAASIQEAERRLGARILLPGYYPERLAWPPAAIHVAGGRHGSVRLAFAARDGGTGLELVAATDAGVDIAPALLSDRTVLGARPTVVGGHPATLASVLVEGVAWQELSWSVNGRAVVLRSQGDLDELVRIARSLHGVSGR
ncbi:MULTISPECIES: hypothetical protein [Anaeromyxobacter]|uniref:hypothetical protein n=1 Tax=Anaeromyxobacter TaxID=161492 RepID=UPI001F595B15|nr:MULTISPECIES: hypothetical protein [unclassified Anaeromyxobacter]